MKFLFVCLALLTSITTFATPYSLEGYQVDAYVKRTVDTGYGLGRIYGYGLDGPFTVKTGTEDEKKYSSIFKLNIDKDKFTLDFIASAGWQDGTVFRIEQPDYATTTLKGFWSGLGSDTNIEGLMFGQGIDVGYGWVELALGKTKFTEDSYFIGYFNYQTVPEPNSLIMLALGIFGITFMRKRSTSS